MSIDVSSQAARDQEKLRRRRRRRLRLIAESIAAPMITLIVVVAWQLAVPLLGVSEFILPTPAAIVERFARDFTLKAHHSLLTLVETLAGFIIAAVAGIATAFAVFYSRVFERAFYPPLVAMQTVPKVSHRADEIDDRLVEPLQSDDGCNDDWKIGQQEREEALRREIIAEIEHQQRRQRLRESVSRMS